MKKTIQTILITSSLAIASVSFAVPNVFTSGQPARASEVNANFDDLQQQIDTNSQDIQTNILDIEAINASQATIYDFRDYQADSTIQSKVFDLSGSFCNGNATTATRSFVRATTAQGTEVTMTRVWDSPTGVCHRRSFRSLSTATERQLLGADTFLTDGTLVSSLLLDTPIVLRTSMMEQGKTFGSAAKKSTQPDGGTAVVDSVLVQSVTALGIEDVTVPAGTYNGCLKMASTRTSQGFGSYNRIAWHCPGVGEVKRLQTDFTNTNYRIWELNAVIYAAP